MAATVHQAQAKLAAAVTGNEDGAHHVVTGDVFGEHPAQVALASDEDPVAAFAADGAHEPVVEAIIWTPEHT